MIIVQETKDKDCVRQLSRDKDLRLSLSGQKIYNGETKLKVFVHFQKDTIFFRYFLHFNRKTGSFSNMVEE